MRRRGLLGRWPWFVIAVVLFFLFAPIFVTAAMSFNDSGFATFPIKGWTLKWYTELVNDERFIRSGILSLKVAAISTAMSVVLGTSAAFGTSTAFTSMKRSRATDAAREALFLAPILIPTLVLAIAMAVGFRLIGYPLSFWTIVAGHTLINAPVIYLLVRARLRGFDWSLIQAARLLGASPATAFRRVTAPLVGPSIIGGAILTFAISLDNFVMSLILTGGDSTLPLLIWSMMRQGFSPSVNAISTILIVVTLALALVSQKLIRGSDGS